MLYEKDEEASYGNDKETCYEGNKEEVMAVELGETEKEESVEEEAVIAAAKRKERQRGIYSTHGVEIYH